MISILKNAKDRRIMHEIVAEEFEAICARVTEKANKLSYSLNNGAGKALISVTRELANDAQVKTT